MDQKQKEVNRKNQQRQQNNQRFSEQFVYNPDFERHIGKYSCIATQTNWVNPKQNYDGFTRFSQYQSHRNTDSSSLAKQLQNVHSISANATINRNLHQQLQKHEPFEAKESPIIVPIDSNNSSRIPEMPLPGFGQFQISTIKRRSSTVRPSQIKSYRDLLNDLQADEFKQFIFNEEQINQISSSAKKQKQKLQQELKAKVMKKKKRQSRVSFKQTPTQHVIIQSQKNIYENMPKIQTYHLKQQQQEQQTSNHNKKQQKQQKYQKSKPLYETQRQQASLKRQPLIKQEQSFQYYSNNQINSQSFGKNFDIKYNSNSNNLNSNINNQNNKSSQQINKNNKQPNKSSYRRKGKQKQMRITDSPQNQENSQKQYNNQKQTNEDKKQQKDINPKKKQIKRPKKDSTKTSKQKYSNQSTKIRVRSQQHEYIQQLTSQQTQKQQSNRYPKRTRIKPVQYWQNQKVHYKAGKAIGIQRTVSLDLKQLFGTKQSYENIINVNFHTHDIQVQLMIPAKKTFQSNGFKDIYQFLQIQISEKSHKSLLQVYFQDQIRSLQMKIGEKISVNSLQHFEIQNKSKVTVYLHLKLKVKV